MNSSSLKMTPEKEKSVKKLLDAKGFEFFGQDHAFWHARSGGVHVIFYRSGSVVIQGSQGEREIWAGRISGDAAVKVMPAATVLGLDESGKGDYFGPLVLAGAVVSPENEEAVRMSGVRDSKVLSNDAVTKAFLKIQNALPSVARVIEPEEYNALYLKHGNVTRLLVAEYDGIIRKLKKEKPGLVILDQFPMTHDQKEKLRRDHPEIRIETKAEKYPAVALASVIARHHFIHWLNQATRTYGLDLPFGCGPRAAALFSRLKKQKAPFFHQVAKTHFREQD